MAALFSTLIKHVGIDIGTTTTKVYAENRGFLSEEPSVVAMDRKRESIIAVGHEAELMFHRAADSVEAMRPLQEGVITDYRVAYTMIQYFIHKSVGKRFTRSRVILAVPYGITDVEKRAMTDAVLQAGAREAYLLESPIAAALSEKLPIFEPIGNFVCDIGGGNMDIAVMSMGGVVIGRSLRMGGDQMNRIIIKYIRDYFNLMVSEATVEAIKLHLGSALPPIEDDVHLFMGRDISNGLEKEMSIRKSEVFQLLDPVIHNILDVLRGVLEQLDPELCSDILARGMLLTGGVARMEGLVERMREELGIPVFMPKEPENAVVQGLRVAAHLREEMDRLFISTKNRKGRS